MKSTERRRCPHWEVKRFPIRFIYQWNPPDISTHLHSFSKASKTNESMVSNLLFKAIYILFFWQWRLILSLSFSTNDQNVHWPVSFIVWKSREVLQSGRTLNWSSHWGPSISNKDKVKWDQKKGFKYKLFQSFLILRYQFNCRWDWQLRLGCFSKGKWIRLLANDNDTRV